MTQQLIDRQTNQAAFPKLNESQMSELSKFARHQTFGAGETLIESGEKDVNFYIVKLGTLKVLDRSSGEDKIISYVGAKEFIGDLTTFKGNPANCSFVVTEDCEVDAITPKKLKQVLGQKSSLSDLILQTFIARSRVLQESDFAGLKVIGASECRDTFRIRDFLDKNHLLFSWINLDRDRDIEELLNRFEVSEPDLPVVVSGSQWILKNPTNEKLAVELGLKEPIENTSY